MAELNSKQAEVNLLWGAELLIHGIFRRPLLLAESGPFASAITVDAVSTPLSIPLQRRHSLSPFHLPGSPPFDLHRSIWRQACKCPLNLVSLLSPIHLAIAVYYSISLALAFGRHS